MVEKTRRTAAGRASRQDIETKWINAQIDRAILDELAASDCELAGLAIEAIKSSGDGTEPAPDDDENAIAFIREMNRLAIVDGGFVDAVVANREAITSELRENNIDIYATDRMVIKALLREGTEGVAHLTDDIADEHMRVAFMLGAFNALYGLLNWTGDTGGLDAARIVAKYAKRDEPHVSDDFDRIIAAIEAAYIAPDED